MNDEEYIQLENLLGKLRMELGYRYAIVPEIVQDCVHIGIYDENGIMKHQTIAPTIKQAVLNLKAKS